MRGVVPDSLLETLAYALRRYGVQIAGSQNFVDNGRVRRLGLWGQFLYVMSV
jgi:hypothetical protein